MRFVRLPSFWIEIRDEKESDECAECREKSEAANMSMELICPDLECSEDGYKAEGKDGFESVRIDEILRFLEMEDKTLRIYFNNETFGSYRITEEEFIRLVKEESFEL